MDEFLSDDNADDDVVVGTTSVAFALVDMPVPRYALVMTTVLAQVDISVSDNVPTYADVHAPFDTPPRSITRG